MDITQGLSRRFQRTEIVCKSEARETNTDDLEIAQENTRRTFGTIEQVFSDKPNDKAASL